MNVFIDKLNKRLMWNQSNYGYNAKYYKIFITMQQYIVYKEIVPNYNTLDINFNIPVSIGRTSIKLITIYYLVIYE